MKEKYFWSENGSNERKRLWWIAIMLSICIELKGCNFEVYVDQDGCIIQWKCYISWYNEAHN